MTKYSKFQPPKWADRFLQFYCNKELLEQLQGDVHELYYWRLAEKGPAAAKRSFIWDVIRLFRWSNIKKRSKTQKLNNMGMLKNYFKIGLRNLWKQRMPSTINVLGLSIALACSIVAFKFIEEGYNKDYMHTNKDDLFLVTHWEELEFNTGRSGNTDNVLTKEILNSVPGIARSTRYNFYRAGTKVNDKETSTYSLFVDEDYLDMFSFQLVAGNINALKQPDQVVINEEAAARFFGQSLAIDQQIELKLGDEWKVFTVGAVMKSGTRSSSLQNYLLVNYSHLEQMLSKTRESWNTNFFIQRQEDVQESQLIAAMDELLPLHNKDNEVNPYKYFELEPLRTMAINSNSMFGGVGSAPDRAPNILLASIALFMLILAVFNYINISLAMVMNRLKEIGIRKVVGGLRGQLVMQFLIENFLLCAFSLFLGVLLSSSFLLPAFNEISGRSLQLDLLSHQNFWYFLLAILVLVTLLSGIYPAVVASAYKPTSILKKTNPKKGKGYLSSFFLSFQMVLALITIIAAVMFVHTNRVNEERDWGYDQFSKLVVPIPDEQYREVFEEKLLNDPNVEAIAGTKARVGETLNGVQFINGEVKKYAELLEVGAAYPELLKLRIASGRLFDPLLKSDLEQKLIVNESFLRSLQLEFDPDGTTVVQDSVNYTIIGVVEDFFYWSPDMKIRGLAMKAIPEEEYTSYLAQMVDGNINLQREAMESVLAEIADDNLFGVAVQEAAFDNHFEESRGIRNVMLFTASIAIFIAAMGLYGLVNVNITSQLKMFGIRKVLGANGRQISLTAIKKYRFVMLFAVLIGASAGVLLVRELLGSVYAYYPTIGFVPIACSIVILLGVAFLTINMQIRKLKKINPAQILRTE